MRLPKILIFLTYTSAIFLLPLLAGAFISILKIIEILDDFYILPFLYVLVPVILFSLAISTIFITHYTTKIRKAHFLIYAILYPLSFASVIGVIAFGVLYLLSAYGSLFSGAGLAAGILFIGILASVFGVAFGIALIWGLIRFSFKRQPHYRSVAISVAILLIIILCLESLALFSAGKAYYRQKATDNLRATISLDQKKIDALKNTSDAAYESCTDTARIRVAHDVWSLVDKSLREAGRPDLVNIISMDLRKSYFGCSYFFEGKTREIEDNPFGLDTLEEMVEIDTARILKNYEHISKESLSALAASKTDPYPLDQEKLGALRNAERVCSDNNLQFVHDIWSELEQQLQKDAYAELSQVVTFTAENNNNPDTDGCIYTVYNLENNKIAGNGWPSLQALGHPQSLAIKSQVETILANMQHQKNDTQKTVIDNTASNSSEITIAHIPLDQNKMQFLRNSYKKNRSLNTCSDTDIKFIHDIWIGIEKELKARNEEKHISDNLFYISSSSTNKPEGCNLAVRSPLNQGFLTISFGTNVPRIKDSAEVERYIQSTINSILSD